MCEALWSNCKWTQSSESKFFLCKKYELLLCLLHRKYPLLATVIYLMLSHNSLSDVKILWVSFVIKSKIIQHADLCMTNHIANIYYGCIFLRVLWGYLNDALLYSCIGKEVCVFHCGRLVFDRESGKPKGYGFCEYKDQETALSAMRNLNGRELNGRALRVDSAASEKDKEEVKGRCMSYGRSVTWKKYNTVGLQ